HRRSSLAAEDLSRLRLPAAGPREVRRAERMGAGVRDVAFSRLVPDRGRGGGGRGGPPAAVAPDGVLRRGDHLGDYDRSDADARLLAPAEGGDERSDSAGFCSYGDGWGW